MIIILILIGHFSFTFVTPLIKYRENNVCFDSIIVYRFSVHYIYFIVSFKLNFLFPIPLKLIE